MQESLMLAIARLWSSNRQHVVFIFAVFKEQYLVGIIVPGVNKVTEPLGTLVHGTSFIWAGTE